MNKILTLIVLALFLSINMIGQTTNFWSAVSEANFEKQGVRQIKPLRFQTHKLNVEGMKQYLSTAPMENNTKSASLVIEFPMPDGTFQKFAITESPIMEAGLAVQFPEIKTYVGQGIDDKSATVRFDFTYKGFHAMIIANDNTTFIDPYDNQTQTEYITYYKKYFVTSKSFHCDFDEEIHGVRYEENPILSTPEQVGEQLRTYRLALACTGEYSNFHGGTVNSVASAMATTMNRVNGVYEREVAIRMILVANNNLLIFLNAGTDPFDNNNTGTLIQQGQTEITNIIGTNNFDIGHVFSTGAGGLAGLGVVCRDNQKGRGVTGIASPVGDPFDIDYVAHEMGHQFAGNHTFNGSSGSCTFNIANNAAYEPGSGTTIMAYAGICAGQNIQNNSNDYFHTHSFDEIIAYSQNNNGNNCPVITNTGNNAPVVSAGTGGFTIPRLTPFELVGSATDPDGDALTYCWEQHDRGPQGAPNDPQGNAPIFRSFAPVNVPIRTFPQISDIVNNTQTMGEILPDYTRNLEFRLTARDNKAGGGGVTYDVIDFNVSDFAGPFLVTEPNTNQTTWIEGAIGNVTWDVANTDLAPVNCATVDILLSIDGGFTYPFTLATGVPNNGTTQVAVPIGSASTQARVKVQAADNIFFDISNQNFTITAPTAPDYVLNGMVTEQTLCGGTDATFSVDVISLLNYTDNIDFDITGLPNGVTANFNNNPFTPAGLVEITVTGTENAATGFYPLQLEAISNSSNQTIDLDLTIYSSETPVVEITAPENGSDGISTFPLLTWEAPGGAAHTYDVRVATVPDFSTVVAATTNTTNTFFIAENLNPYAVYYWQVRATNECVTGDWSTTAAFRTATSTCETFTGSESRNMIASIAFTYNSALTVSQDVTITDVNVKNTNIRHQDISDVAYTLESPAGTVVDLMTNNCVGLTGFSEWNVSFDDAVTASTITCNSNVNTTVKPTGSLAAFNGENSQGTWNLKIQDSEAGNGGVFNSYELEICYALANTNEDPILVNNDTLKVGIGATEAIIIENLLSTDTDNTAGDLVYTILENTQNGQVLLNGTALNVGSTFTQADIDANNVSYQHNGIIAEFDRFQFDVNDSNGGWFGTPYFEIQTGDFINIVNAENPFAIFPNPAVEDIKVNFFLATPQDVTIFVFDVLGRKVKEYNLSSIAAGANQFEIPVQQLSAGNYIIRFESDAIKATEKIIVIK